MGQVVSEIGDHFNSIAVLSLAVHLTNSGVAAGGVMIARTVFALIAGPIAGVTLDRFDRKKIMLASDLFRAVVALGFVLILTHRQRWLLYVLSGLLMFASPFFTSGRSAILPRITTKEQLHTANALTQTTAWMTLSFGTLFGGVSTMQFGYEWAFVVNSLSFVFSAWAIWSLRSPEGHFRPDRASPVAAKQAPAFWAEFFDSLRYMRSTPLIFAIALGYVGWATGGGAAQVLFTLFGELVFRRGPAGIGIIWSAAGFGLVAGGFLAHWLGKRVSFAGYRHTISIAFFVHGVSYILYAVMPTIALASLFVGLSRVGMGVLNVLNRTMLLTHVPDHYRGRVFSTVEMMMNATMMMSLAAASVAAGWVPIRTIGVVAGCLSASAALFWAVADFTGRLPEPAAEPESDEAFESRVTRA
ncbi:MAG: MFS transporter [Acidobacteria bacterium]|nr:MFS transporter [Acidobacteriota bacterium]